jgi:TfoX/Sxy family transcriptional regulator of competence genes
VKWRKPPAELVDLFLSLVPDNPEVDVRAMFGAPCFFCHGHLFAGVHQESLIVRLGDDERAALLALPGARRFEPMPGRAMREYTCVPEAMLSDREALEAWLARALAYALTLPAKQKKPRKPRSPTGSRKPGPPASRR